MGPFVSLPTLTEDISSLLRIYRYETRHYFANSRDLTAKSDCGKVQEILIPSSIESALHADAHSFQPILTTHPANQKQNSYIASKQRHPSILSGDAHLCDIRSTGTHPILTRRIEEYDYRSTKDKTTTHLTHTQLRHHFIFLIQNHRHPHRVGPTRNRRRFQFSTFQTSSRTDWPTSKTLQTLIHASSRPTHLNTSNHKHSSFTKPLISDCDLGQMEGESDVLSEMGKIASEKAVGRSTSSRTDRCPCLDRGTRLQNMSCENTFPTFAGFSPSVSRFFSNIHHNPVISEHTLVQNMQLRGHVHGFHPTLHFRVRCRNEEVFLERSNEVMINWMKTILWEPGCQNFMSHFAPRQIVDIYNLVIDPETTIFDLQSEADFSSLHVAHSIHASSFTNNDFAKHYCTANVVIFFQDTQITPSLVEALKNIPNVQTVAQCSFSEFFKEYPFLCCTEGTDELIQYQFYPSQVSADLFVSGYLPAGYYQGLCNLGIGHVLNCTHEVENYFMVDPTMDDDDDDELSDMSSVRTYSLMSFSSVLLDHERRSPTPPLAILPSLSDTEYPLSEGSAPKDNHTPTSVKKNCFSIPEIPPGSDEQTRLQTSDQIRSNEEQRAAQYLPGKTMSQASFNSVRHSTPAVFYSKYESDRKMVIAEGREMCKAGPPINYLRIPLDDSADENLLAALPTALRFITNAIRSHGSKVLVHCQQGISRSTSIVIAYLMLTCRSTYSETLQHVCHRRTIARPNDSFSKQLKQFDKLLSKQEGNIDEILDAIVIAYAPLSTVTHIRSSVSLHSSIKDEPSEPTTESPVQLKETTLGADVAHLRQSAEKMRKGLSHHSFRQLHFSRPGHTRNLHFTYNPLFGTKEEKRTRREVKGATRIPEIEKGMEEEGPSSELNTPPIFNRSLAAQPFPLTSHPTVVHVSSVANVVKETPNPQPQILPSTLHAASPELLNKNPYLVYSVHPQSATVPPHFNKKSEINRISSFSVPDTIDIVRAICPNHRCQYVIHLIKRTQLYDSVTTFPPFGSVTSFHPDNMRLNSISNFFTPPERERKEATPTQPSFASVPIHSSSISPVPQNTPPGRSFDFTGRFLSSPRLRAGSPSSQPSSLPSHSSQISLSPMANSISFWEIPETSMLTQRVQSRAEMSEFISKHSTCTKCHSPLTIEYRTRTQNTSHMQYFQAGNIALNEDQPSSIFLPPPQTHSIDMLRRFKKKKMNVNSNNRLSSISTVPFSPSMYGFASFTASPLSTRRHSPHPLHVPSPTNLRSDLSTSSLSLTDTDSESPTSALQPSGSSEEMVTDPSMLFKPGQNGPIYPPSLSKPTNFQPDPGIVSSVHHTPVTVLHSPAPVHPLPSPPAVVPSPTMLEESPTHPIIVVPAPSAKEDSVEADDHRDTQIPRTQSHHSMTSSRSQSQTHPAEQIVVSTPHINRTPSIHSHLSLKQSPKTVYINGIPQPNPIAFTPPTALHTHHAASDSSHSIYSRHSHQSQHSHPLPGFSTMSDPPSPPHSTTSPFSMSGPQRHPQSPPNIPPTTIYRSMTNPELFNDDFAPICPDEIPETISNAFKSDHFIEVMTYDDPCPLDIPILANPSAIHPLNMVPEDAMSIPEAHTVSHSNVDIILTPLSSISFLVPPRAQPNDETKSHSASHLDMNDTGAHAPTGPPNRIPTLTEQSSSTGHLSHPQLAVSAASRPPRAPRLPNVNVKENGENEEDKCKEELNDHTRSDNTSNTLTNAHSESANQIGGSLVIGSPHSYTTNPASGTASPFEDDLI
ncbi:putative Dual specificity phosphatase, catalytic domain containing protein [Blattamonas nauphoetae]|uniref:protein-tyrosine-phosphatase n=1 Tax=Blattamonas nauphoetae TaxID=2049346 RepID=A0ABQ9Y646_9EUKA|nr:putative Dual specificity phosphatase, catalytic domain containing protein [Blattamonas nauphoetae]